jgi:hypothetical protein
MCFLEQYPMVVPFHATTFHSLSTPQLPNIPIIPCSIEVNYWFEKLMEGWITCASVVNDRANL